MHPHSRLLHRIMAEGVGLKWKREYVKEGFDEGRKGGVERKGTGIVGVRGKGEGEAGDEEERKGLSGENRGGDVNADRQDVCYFGQRRFLGWLWPLPGYCVLIVLALLTSP